MYPGPSTTIRAMIKRHLLRHPLLPKPVFDTDGATPPDSLQFQSYEEIHSSSIREMLEYCKSINQPRLFRYFWSNWYRPGFRNFGSRWEIASLCGRPGFNAIIPISRTTMRLESHWRILKKDYGSRFIKPRLDVLVYIICSGLVRSRIPYFRQSLVAGVLGCRKGRLQGLRPRNVLCGYPQPVGVPWYLAARSMAPCQTADASSRCVACYGRLQWYETKRR
ncbi:hypothetical protein V1521DRAFT_124143 [Lipomyces starkeyi]